MRWSRVLPASLAVALGMGCSETGVEVADLVGTWDATKFEFIDAAGGDPVRTFDIILVDGSVTIVLGADSTYEVTVTLPFAEPEVETGTWVVDGSRLTLTSGGVTTEVTVLEVELSGTTLNVTADDLVFDIDEDGDEDPVLLEAIFVKTVRAPAGRRSPSSFFVLAFTRSSASFHGSGPALGGLLLSWSSALLEE